MRNASSGHNPLRWYQFRPRFLLLLMTFVASVTPFVAPMGYVLGFWCTPDNGGKAAILRESRPDPVFERAFQVVLEGGAKSTAHRVNLHDHLAELERSEKTDADSSQQPPSQALPGQLR